MIYLVGIKNNVMVIQIFWDYNEEKRIMKMIKFLNG